MPSRGRHYHALPSPTVPGRTAFLLYREPRLAGHGHTQQHPNLPRITRAFPAQTRLESNPAEQHPVNQNAARNNECYNECSEHDRYGNVI